MLESENNRRFRKCFEHLDKFIRIYPKDKNTDGLAYKNEIPENVKVTVYCVSDEGGEGFFINVIFAEIIPERWIAKKWILHSELEALVGCKIS